MLIEISPLTHLPPLIMTLSLRMICICSVSQVVLAVGHVTVTQWGPCLHSVMSAQVSVSVAPM